MLHIAIRGRILSDHPAPIFFINLPLEHWSQFKCGAEEAKFDIGLSKPRSGRDERAERAAARVIETLARCYREENGQQALAAVSDLNIIENRKQLASSFVFQKHNIFISMEYIVHCAKECANRQWWPGHTMFEFLAT